MWSERSSMSDADRSNLRIWIFAAVATGIAILIWLCLPAVLTGSYNTISEKGAYGDTYGTVNALFTALAFVGVITTILLQRKELTLQRQELKLTREELAGQKKQLQIQSDTFKQQRFENTFFELLRVHIDIVSALSSSDGMGRNESRGRECLARQKRILRSEYMKFSEENVSTPIDEAFEVLYKNYPPHLGHYFRQLYHIVNFVDKSEIEEKQRYADFVQAQLNNNELILLAYNGLSRHGENFKSLIEEYGLLENLTWGTLFAEDHADMYCAKAFGKRGYQHES